MKDRIPPLDPITPLPQDPPDIRLSKQAAHWAENCRSHATSWALAGFSAALMSQHKSLKQGKYDLDLGMMLASKHEVGHYYVAGVEFATRLVEAEFQALKEKDRKAKGGE